MIGAKKKFISQEYSAEQGGRNLREGTAGSRKGTIFAAVFFSFSLLIGVCLISFTLVFFMAAVEGTSMMTTLNASGANTDSVLVNKVVKPKIGDVIVIEHYENNQFKALHIKRLIARGGDRVGWELGDNNNYVLRVNGEISPWQSMFYDNKKSSQYNAFYNYMTTPVAPNGSDRPNSTFNAFYTPKGSSTPLPFKKESTTTPGKYELVLPEGWIFYMGDNRGGNGTTDYDTYSISKDSTAIGPIPESRIVGVVDPFFFIKKPIQEWIFDRFIQVITFGIVKR